MVQVPKGKNWPLIQRLLDILEYMSLGHCKEAAKKKMAAFYYLTERKKKQKKTAYKPEKIRNYIQSNH